MEYYEILALQRNYFNSGKIKAYQYRADALKVAREALIHYKQEINQVLMDDLNKSRLKLISLSAAPCGSRCPM